MNVLITLTTAGVDTGPFNLYSNTDSYTTAFQTGVAKSALIAGYTSTVVPAGTTTVRVKSTGTCTNYVDLVISGAPVTTTTTTTPSPTPTTTTTTTSGGTTTTTTTQIVTYYNVLFCGNESPGVIRYNGPNNLSAGVVVQSDNGNCYTVVNVGTGPASSGTVLGEYSTCESCGLAPTPTTTTTTTTQLQWYQLTRCSDSSIDYSAGYAVGYASINSRVTDFGSNPWRVTNTYSTDQGGSGLFIYNTGFTGCPEITPTTTTTTTSSTPTLSCYTLSIAPGSEAGCGDTNNNYENWTITTYDQFGNLYNVPSNSTFDISFTYFEQNDTGNTGPETQTVPITITAGNNTKTDKIYTYYNLNCNFSSLCDGSCFYTRTSLSVSSTPSSIGECPA